MARLFFGLIMLGAASTSYSQGIPSRFQTAFSQMEADAQLKHASVGFYLVNSKTGERLFEKNGQMGMAPASSQKVLTGAAAFELLGTGYRYTTELSYAGRIENGVLKGNLYLAGSGDPTLGSWRWQNTREDRLLKRWATIVKSAGIHSVEGGIYSNQHGWGTATVPDGWIWQDIGNYYGAGPSTLNWRENQYDLILRSGSRIGDTCRIVATHPKLTNAELICEVTTAARGSGDNAYIYLPPYSQFGFVRGTIPAGEPAFAISGSFPNSGSQLLSTLEAALDSAGVVIRLPSTTSTASNRVEEKKNNLFPLVSLYKHVSPSLDSINYWFLKKSINLYGEAIVKTIAFQKAGSGSAEKGLEMIKNFWSQRGIEQSAINIIDGSGLSPQNRVSADALVKVMQYARSRTWFRSFYDALPEINGIRMKSGSIGGVISYTGYLSDRDGNEYTFAFIVNNYNGSPGEMKRKMWRLLDILK